MKDRDDHFGNHLRGHQIAIELDALDQDDSLRACGACWACRRGRECKQPLTDEQVIALLEEDHAETDQEQRRELRDELTVMPVASQDAFMAEAAAELGYHPPRPRKDKGRRRGSAHTLDKLEERLTNIRKRLRAEGKPATRTDAKQVMAAEDNTEIGSIERRFERARERARRG